MMYSCFVSSMAKFTPGDKTDTENELFPTDRDATFNVRSNCTNLTSTQSGTDSSMLCSANDEFNPTVSAKRFSSLFKRNRRSGNNFPIFCQNTSTSEMRVALSSLGLTQENVEFIIHKGENYLERPHRLSRKLRITKELADRALANYKNFKENLVLELTPKICKTIKKCLKDFPYLDSHEDIALVCKVDKRLVLKYLEQQPINVEQKKLMLEEYNKGKSIEEISKFLNFNPKKVEECITATCASFSDSTGKSVLEIIYKHCGNIPIFTLRQIIWSKDLKLQLYL